MTIVKFPYNACRRVHSRKPRVSKSGTPEERAAAAKAPAATVLELSRRPAPQPREWTTQEIVDAYNDLDPGQQAYITEFIENLIAKRTTSK